MTDINIIFYENDTILLFPPTDIAWSCINLPQKVVYHDYVWVCYNLHMMSYLDHPSIIMLDQRFWLLSDSVLCGSMVMHLTTINTQKTETSIYTNWSVQ